jgi:hypothetical protein
MNSTPMQAESVIAGDAGRLKSHGSDRNAFIFESLLSLERWSTNADYEAFDT